MGIALSDTEAWEFVASSLTGMVTTLRRDGYPVTLPVWFVVEAGERWAELIAVSFQAAAARVTDEPLCARVLAARDAKYDRRGLGSRSELPAATVRHYAGESAIIRLTPVGQLISW